MWYQDLINLFEARLVGPFDFEKDHKIHEDRWNELLTTAKVANVYTANVNRQITLGDADRQDKSNSGVPSNHMAFRWTLEKQFD